MLRYLLNGFADSVPLSFFFRSRPLHQGGGVSRCKNVGKKGAIRNTLVDCFLAAEGDAVGSMRLPAPSRAFCLRLTM